MKTTTLSTPPSGSPRHLHGKQTKMRPPISVHGPKPQESKSLCPSASTHSSGASPGCVPPEHSLVCPWQHPPDLDSPSIPDGPDLVPISLHPLLLSYPRLPQQPEGPLFLFLNMVSYTYMTYMYICTHIYIYTHVYTQLYLCNIKCHFNHIIQQH